MSVNPGVKLYFRRLVRITRIAGSRLLTGPNIDQRGFRGAVNLVFAPTDAAWHCDFHDRGFRFVAGLHPAPLGTVRLDEDLFLRMLAGMISYQTAEMTGQIRVEGDGHSALVISTTVLQTRSHARRRGLSGWLSRYHLKSVLRRSGKGYELQL